jgi:EmrB/QacA subfamily drug resistance transporter
MWFVGPSRVRSTSVFSRPLSRVFSRVEYQWVVATAFVLALFMDILDVSIVNVSLVKISQDFKASIGSTTWIVLGYSLSLAIWIPISGWVGDRFGTRRTFIFALCIFIAASLLCSRASTISELVGFRLLQGVGGGMLTPTGVTLLFRAFPPEQRAKASTVLAVPTILAPASGPVLGGYLTDHPGWRWIFGVNIPIGVVALIVAVFGLRKDDEATKRPFDGAGFVLASIGFPAAVFALERGAADGWLSGKIIGALIIAIVSLTALVVWSRRSKTPMLDLRLLEERLFRTSNIVSFASTMAFLGMVFILPQFLQRVAGLDAFHSGLATFPQALGLIVMSRFAGRWYPTIGPRRMLVFSYVGLSIATLPFLFLTVETSAWVIRAIMFTRGLMLAFSFIPLQAASYARITPEQTGRASAVFSTQRQLGAAVGVAALSTMMLSKVPRPFGPGVVEPAYRAGFTNAFHWAFGLAALFTFVAGILSMTINDEDAAATMTRNPDVVAPPAH